MSLRLVEILVPDAERADLVESLRSGDGPCRCVDVWCLDGSEERSAIRVLVSTEHSEGLLDFVVEVLGHQARIVVTAVEATLPRVEEEAPEGEAANSTAEGARTASSRKGPWVFQRISREELYSDIVDAAKLTPSYFAMVVASTLVAAIGLLQDDVAVIIGAMVIAPLLGPNVALALATTLGDLELGWTSLKVNASGVAVALVPATAIGFFLFPTDPTGQIASRSTVGFLDLAVALVAGGAGALSFTLGVPAALVGVMVAVALMPPLVVFGMAVGAAQWQAASGALLLTSTNIICVNLAGVLTFLALGIRPATWYEAARAKAATRTSLLFWIGLLAILVSLIYVTS